MMKTPMFLCTVTAMMACAPDPSTVPLTSRFVPVERAYQNAPCETNGATGGVCARDGDFCPQGGYRPARYECIFNTWRCTVDTTRSCPAPSQRMECSRGDYLGPCNFRLSCPDGSPVPAEYECVGGQRVCLPIGDCSHMPEPDAGATPDSGRSPARLTVTLANDPRSQTVTRNATVTSLGVTFTADPMNDLLVSRLRVRGIGDSGSGFRMVDLQRVITACTIRDGDAQIGNAMTPDSTGMMDFRALNFTVRRGFTRTLTVRCTMDSVVELPGGDRFALGIVNGTDIEVQDTDGNAPIITLDPALENQLRIPTVITTVLRSGSYTITSTAMYTRDFTGGLVDWQTVGSYELVVTTEDIAIDWAAIQWTGNELCINELAIVHWTGGGPYGTARTSSRTTNVDVAFDRPMVIRAATPTRIYIIARFNPTVDPTHTPVGCFPGSTLTFSLGSNLTSGEWDSTYAGRYNLRVSGSTSGERIRTDSPAQRGITAVIR